MNRQEELTQEKKLQENTLERAVEDLLEEVMDMEEATEKEDTEEEEEDMVAVVMDMEEEIITGTDPMVMIEKEVTIETDTLPIEEKAEEIEDPDPDLPPTETEDLEVQVLEEDRFNSLRYMNCL